MLSLALMPLYSLAQQTTSAIEQQAFDFIYQQYTEKLPEAQIDIKIIPIKKTKQRLNCPQGFQFSPIKRLSARPLIKASCDNNSTGTLFIRAKVSASSPAIVAAMRIERGQNITPQAIKIDHIDALRHKNFITDTTNISNLIATRTLSAGTVITHNFVKAPPTISKGDALMIEANRAGLTIRTAGTARESGQKGKFISVINSRSGKTVKAEIIAKGLVRTP